MTRNLNASWYTQRTINGFAVQWRLTEKTYVTAHPNQYGAFPSMSYPTDAIGNDDLFSEFKKAALHARYERSGLARYGDRFSDARERLCDLVVDELNQRGVTPHKQLSVDHRPDWKQDQAETSRLPQLGVTPDNFDKLLSDVLADMNADNEATAAATTQKDDSF